MINHTSQPFAANEIMVIDDSEENRIILSELLIHKGYRVSTAGNGKAALALIAENPPELILLDIMMPEFDGYEVCQILKADKKNCHIPVIFISAFSDPENKVKGFNLGAVDFIDKPFQPEEILARINTHLQLFRLQNQLEDLVHQASTNLIIANSELRAKIFKCEKLEKSLQDSAERFIQLAENIQEVFYVYDLKQNQLLYISPAYEQIWQQPLITVYDDPQSFSTSIHPDDQSKFQEALQREAEFGEYLNIEYRIITPDNKIRWIWSRNFPVQNHQNMVYRIVGIAENITKRKQAELAMEESETRYRELFHNMSSGVTIYEAVDNGDDFILKDINTAGEKIENLKKSDIIGKSLLEIFPNANELGLLELLQKVWRSRKPQRLPITQYQNHRMINWRENYVYRLANGELVSVYDDITESKKMENEIKDNLKEKESLLQEIHHRVKNNMQTIISLLRLKYRRLQDENTVMIFKESENRILSMAMIHEKLYQSDNFASIPFEKYIQELASMIISTYRFTNSQIALNTNIEEGISFKIDAAISLGLCLNEIISNCLKHAFSDNRKGEISISLHSISNGRFELIISDNGIGMSAKLDLNNTRTMGFNLLSGWVKYELNGELKVDSDNGTKVIINGYYS